MDMRFPIAVPGVGPVPCRYMVIGEAPGREEIKELKPFVGRSGELLTDAIEKAGATRDDIYITNIFKGDVGAGNRNPTEEEILEHSKILIEEILDVQPERILLVGAVPTRYFLGSNIKITEASGNVYDYDGLSELYPCLHPAFVLRQRNVFNVNKFYSTIKNFLGYN